MNYFSLLKRGRSFLPKERLSVPKTSKSYILAITGLWTSRKGTIFRPALNEMLFLPQRPYMLRGNLREQLLYPNPKQVVDDQFLLWALKSVNLPDLAQRFGGLDAEENWEDVLSLGEQQRVALGRVLVTQPRYAILDEATSALDVQNEATLYQSPGELGTTYVSVGHRPTLINYHHQCLEILEGGQWQLRSLEPKNEG